jgi:hypothetical protein
MKGILFAISLVALGCGAPPPSPTMPAANEAGKKLTAKLKGMTPAERSAYLKKHPEELQAVMSGGGTPAKTP